MGYTLFTTDGDNVIREFPSLGNAVFFTQDYIIAKSDMYIIGGGSKFDADGHFIEALPNEWTIESGTVVLARSSEINEAYRLFYQNCDQLPRDIIEIKCNGVSRAARLNDGRYV